MFLHSKRHRAPVTLGAVAAIGALATVPPACGPEFSSCEAQRTCPSEPSDGGAPEGGGDGTHSGSPHPSGGGSSGTDQGDEKGDEAAILGGAGGARGAGDEEAGASGALPEPGGEQAPEGVVLDAPCTENAALACAGVASKLSLICRAGRWQPNQTCTSDQNCDDETGVCADIPSVCAGKDPGERYCAGDTLIECGRDLVSFESTECAGRCVEEAGDFACAAPKCSDGKVQAPEECDDGNTAPWDGCSSTCTVEVVALALGAYHSCALGGNGVLKCWGDNSLGQLGLGDREARGDQRGEMGAALPAVDLGTGRTAKAVSAGEDGTCAILDDDSLKCWGYAPLSGIGAAEDHQGDEPGEMGDALPRVNLGSGRFPKAVSVGRDHACAILDNNTLKCWGRNHYAALGLGDEQARGDDPGEMGDALPTVELGAQRFATAVMAGYNKTCAVLDDGSTKCWGFGNDIGLPDGESRGDAPAEMGDNMPAMDFGAGRRALSVVPNLSGACALLDDNSMKCWRWTDPPTPLSAPPIFVGAGRTVVGMGVGYWHVCNLLDDHSVKCWGGYPDYYYGEYWSDVPVYDLGAGRSVRLLAAGATHSCALLDDGRVKCWGSYNGEGQLGTGDTLPRGVALSERGDAIPTVDLRF